MPILIAGYSHATPHKVLEYITDGQKCPDVWNAVNMVGRDPLALADQMMDTMRCFGKNSHDHRKYYHYVLSFSLADDVTPELCQELGEKWLHRFAREHEGVVATHTDKAHMHAHIVWNAVNMSNGSKYRIDPKKSDRMKDYANEIAAERGLSTVDWREAGADREKDCKYRDKETYNTMSMIKEKIDMALQETKATGGGWQEFKANLADLGVTINRDGQSSLSYLDETRRKAIRAKTMGLNYGKDHLLAELYGKDEVNGYDDVEKVRRAVEMAMLTARTEPEFEQMLKDEGVKISRKTEKTISFMVGSRKQAIRDRRLGDGFSKVDIDKAIKENSQCKNDAELDQRREARLRRQCMRQEKTAGNANRWVGVYFRDLMRIYSRMTPEELTGDTEDLLPETRQRLLDLSARIAEELRSSTPTGAPWEAAVKRGMEDLQEEFEDLPAEDAEQLAKREQEAFVFDEIVDKIHYFGDHRFFRWGSDAEGRGTAWEGREHEREHEEMTGAGGGWLFYLLHLRFRRNADRAAGIRPPGRLYHSAFGLSLSKDAKEALAKQHQKGSAVLQHKQI